MSKIRLWDGLKFGVLEILFSVNTAFESQTAKINRLGHDTNKHNIITGYEPVTADQLPLIRSHFTTDISLLE